MKGLQLTIIALILNFATVAQCSKDLEKHEKYSTGPLIHSKDIVFDSPTISNTKDIAFHVKDSSRMFVHFDITYGTWRVGSKVDLTLESGTVITTYISKWEKEVKGNYQAKRYDCQIMSRDDLDKIYIEPIRKVTVHCVGKTYEISTKKRQKLNRYFQCAANTVGIENINFTPAAKVEQDPSSNNTIVVSFGEDQSNNTSNYDHVNCEYEKNQVDEFTGDKTTITKWHALSSNLEAQIHHINGKTFLNLRSADVLGCVNVESFVYIKFIDASTLKLMNLAKEDCGDKPIIKVELTSKMSIMKIRDIEKIRVSLSDGHADVTVADQVYIKGVLNKCI